jgi:hypothetical protein
VIGGRQGWLARIVELSSAATYDNGKIRIHCNTIGLEGERLIIISDFMDSIEDAGYCIRQSIFRMWEGERDRGALLEGLDMPSQRVMGWMLDRLAVEEAGEDEEEDPEMAVATVNAKLAEEAVTAALLAADPSAGGKDGAGKERLLFFLEVLLIFKQGFAEVRAALEGIFAGRRDCWGLSLGLPPRGVAFVRMVLNELERPAVELHAAVLNGNEDFEDMRM